MALDTDNPESDSNADDHATQHAPAARRRRRREALARVEASRAEQGGVDPAVYWSILPVLIFWGTRQVASSQLAIGLGFAAAVVVFWLNRRRKKGVIAWIALAGLLIVSGSAVAGLVLDSEKAYLSSDPIGDGITVLVALVSVAVGRPIMGMVVCEVFPRFSSHLKATDRVFVIATLLLAAKDLTTGIARIFLLDGLDTDGYLIFSRVVSWPVNALYFYIAYRLIDRANRDAIRQSVHDSAA